MERKANLIQIISKYKVKHQLKKLNEEIFEFTEAVIDNELTMTKDAQHRQALKNHIAEEFADCMVLLMQFKLFLGINDDDINRIMDEKIQRQINRMKAEEGENL